MAQEGFEPSASLVLSESGLPVAYRAKSSSGGWNRTSGLHVQSVVSLPTATTPELAIREGGFEPPPPDSKSGRLPVSRFPRAPCGSRTRISGLGSPCLAARPRTLSSIHDHRIRAPAGGVEPPIVALTGRRPTVGPHRCWKVKSGWPDLNRRSPAPKAGGLNQAFLHPE